jgi:hypothetical protein
MFRVRGRLCVALDEPQDLRRTDEIARVTGLTVRPVFAFRSDVDRMLDRCYADDFEVDEVTADMANNDLEVCQDSIEVALHSLDSLVEGSPVINLVNYLILQAIRQGASDIHVERHAIRGTSRPRPASVRLANGHYRLLQVARWRISVSTAFLPPRRARCSALPRRPSRQRQRLSW